KNGEPRTFRADLTYRPEPDAAPRKYALTVNNPLRLDGDRVYLISHGYAPTVTVRMPDGTSRTETQAFLPTDASTLYSEGAFKLLGKPNQSQDVGISGFFAPTPGLGASGLVTSVSADVKNPILGMFVYIGAINPNGTPESVYRLTTSGLKQIGKPTNLVIGQTKTFPNGIAITFDGWKPWVSLQVSHDPTQGYLLIAAAAMVIGLALSLGVRRRRLWIRIAPARTGEHGSPTVVTVGGLARSDSGNFTAEFSSLLDRLRSVTADEGAEHVASETDDHVGAVSVGSGKKD
ncbi:MAG: cytochrome c biogenesis protein ResB, partial [Jatrophihabitans sp.]